MTMASSFDDLLREIGELHAHLGQHLQWSVLNARPEPAEHVLAGRFEDWSVEIVSAVEEAEMAVRRGRAAASAGAMDLGITGKALLDLHQLVRRSSRLFNCELASFETMDALRRLANAEETTIWAPWADSVSEALISCREPFEQLEDTVADAWANWVEIACVSAGNGVPHASCRRKREGESRSTEEGFPNG
ncbi:hypothetical protein [Bradyrhizobium japonicum]|uniref:hypothetical protein n=1 Tax=Bradyrhizobium japonicum TaxID=375 RepID=UPI0027154415|nr:hypothetical protein [Bradyrhizobium japonicum]WLB58021.1 hypothetical protein QIH94_19130 [Bradyrhizobium japonicum]WLB60112.1 hypothetical protein QIH96_26810 [Bradyrhizobium japonicum]